MSTTKDFEETLQTAIIIAAGGTGALLITGIFQFTFGYGMNSLFSQVRSLSVVTHYNMMMITFPASCIQFFAVIYEYVTYDVIPTDNLYEDRMGLPYKPFSANADKVGYPSTSMIPNLGSVPIFIIITILSMLTWYIIVRMMKNKNGCAYRFARRKLDGFFWAGCHDFINETYIAICFAACINYSDYKFSSGIVAFSNIFALFMTAVYVSDPLIIAIKAYRRWKLETKIGEAKIQKEGGEEEKDPQVQAEEPAPKFTYPPIW